MKRLSALLLCLTLALACLPARAETTVVRVGWYEQPGYMETYADGTHGGYLYEYLQCVAQYTGWTYAFVPGAYAQLSLKLQSGQIDLMGCVYATEANQSRLDLSRISIGTEKVSLFTRAESELTEDDFDSFQGLTIAVMTGSPNVDYLLEYAAANGFSFDLKHMPSLEDISAAVGLWFLVGVVI